jgi:hypothetical protein
MSDVFTGYVLTYGVCVVEAALFVYLVARGHAKRYWELVFYLAVSLGVGVARTCALNYYGFSSSKYGYCYWTTDLLLVLAAFVLVVSFFRRACSENREMWQFVRMLLTAVIVAIGVISYFSLASHHDNFFSIFIIEFSQNLYFASLVLTTLLYLMTLRMEIADERLGMIVCGLGIEFAGPAASLALFYLTNGEWVSRIIGVYFIPLCDIGMILTWFYAISRVPGPAKAPRTMVEPVPAFARGNLSNF